MGNQRGARERERAAVGGEREAATEATAGRCSASGAPWSTASASCALERERSLGGGVADRRSASSSSSSSPELGRAQPVGCCAALGLERRKDDDDRRDELRAAATGSAGGTLDSGIQSV